MQRRSFSRQFSTRIWRACQRWNNAECVDLSAAFAYYVLQSFFPLLLIALSVAARLFGRPDSLDNVLASVTQVLPPSVTTLVDSTLRGLVEQGFGAGILGVVVLLLTASNAYLTLQRGADRLWSEILPEPSTTRSWSQQLLLFCRNRIEAFLTVFAISILIVIEQLLLSVQRLPEGILNVLDGFIPGLISLVRSSPILPVGRILIPALILSFLALLLQSLLPSRRVPIMPLIPGSLLIGFGLAFLNSTLSLSIVSLGNRFQAYGVIGGVLVLTFWVWLVGVILYFGQCLSVELAEVRLNQSRPGEPNSLMP
nr:YihY/virulence factor BrkB family protein [Synechococcus sp. KORDI-52]